MSYSQFIQWVVQGNNKLVYQYKVSTYYSFHDISVGYYVVIIKGTICTVPDVYEYEIHGHFFNIRFEGIILFKLK